VRRAPGRARRDRRGGSRRGAPLGLTAELDRYLAALTARLREHLGGDLVAVILSGSGATGSLAPASSDVDVIAIAAGAVQPERLEALAGAADHAVLPCPARKLELVVYPRAEVQAPGPRPRFLLNLNTGAGLETHRSLDPAQEPAHWFPLDLALARDRGRSLLGPPPAELIGPVPRDVVLAALAQSLDWHESREPASPNTVLNACRAWRFALDGALGSKEEGAAWARARAEDPGVIDAALEARRAGARLDVAPERVAALVAATRSAVTQARQDLRNGST
jgi:hypothetical protein